MTVKRHYLTQDEIAEQFKAANFYKSLIEKELAFNNLCNLENIQVWAKAYKHHMELISIGFVEVEFEYSNY
jgi:hypothetical protein